MMREHPSKTARTAPSFTPVSGGRLIKWKGKAASLSPVMAGSVSSLALTAALSAATLMGAAHPAQAGSCTVVDGVYVCSGAAVPGEQAININVDGPVTVTTTAGFGLDSSGTNTIRSSGSLSFSDNFQSAIKGSSIGLNVSNQGTGALSITTTGAVTGTAGRGIFATSTTDGTDMSIAVTDVTGGDEAIYALHNGSGALAITSTGNVTSISRNGIQVRNIFSTNTTIEANSVTGAGIGIQASQSLSGALSISATGAVAGTSSYSTGIDAFSPNADLTITATDVSGGYRGIRASSTGSGAISITTTGTVSATTISHGTGIYTTSSSSGGTSISAVDVDSVGTGVVASNYGTGATTVTTTGTVTAGNGDGIRVINYERATGDITISANTVTGSARGIYAIGLIGNVTITTTGAVSATRTGAGGYNGIYVNTSNNATVDIAGMVTATGEAAAINMQNVGGTATLALRAGWGLTGRADGNFNTNSVIALRGDADSALDLGDLGANIRGFSGLVKEGASNWTLTGSTDEFVFNKVDIQAGTLTLDSATLGLTAFGKKRVVSRGTVLLDLTPPSGPGISGPDSDDLPRPLEPIPAVLSIAAQGTLAAFGTSQVTGMVSNAGTISLRNGTAGDRLQITSNLTGQGGTLAFDTVMDNGAGGGTSDRVQVAGNLDGTHNVVINPLGAGALTVEDGILLVEVAGTSTADALSMQGGGLLRGGFLYKLDQGGAAAGTANNWYLQSEKVAVAQTVAAIPVAQLGFGTVNSFSQRSTGRTSVQPSGPSGGGDDTVTVSSKSMPSMPSLAGATLWISGSASQDEGTLNKALAGTRFDNTGNTLSVGVDLPTQGAWVLGVSGQVGKLSSTVFDALTSSKAETDAYSLGFSATWQGGSDRYVDVQAQVATFSTDYTSAAGTLQRDATSDSFSFGVEAGQTYTLGTATTVTPYVQLSRSVLDGGSFTAAGATYDMGRNGSTVARVGAKLDHRLAGGQRVYASAELLHDFDPSREITINGTSLSYDAPENALSSALGMELDLAGNDRLFAEIAYTSDLSSDVRAKGASLTIGYAKTW